MRIKNTIEIDFGFNGDLKQEAYIIVGMRF